MKKIIRIAMIPARLLVLAALVLPMFSSSSSRAVTSAPTATTAAAGLTVGVRDELTELDPALAEDSASLLVTTQVYDTLVRYTPGGSTLAPGLAQSWSVSADGLTWTFNLRAGVTFHDSAPLDAAAVLFNFNRWWDKGHPQHVGSFPYFEAMFGGFKDDPGSLIGGLSASGSQQFIIQLTRPYNPLLSLLTFPAFAIGSPGAIQAGGLSDYPTGSGPFIFDEWVTGDHVRLDANLAYWGGRPAADSLTFALIPGDPDRLDALQNNAVQVAVDLPNSYALTAVLDENLRLYNRPPARVGYLGINRAHTPLDNLLVRKAIAHAINMPALLAAHYGLGYQQAMQFIPPDIWGYESAAPEYNYNPLLAVELLQQAGYAGETITLSYRDVARPYLPDPGGVAQAIAADLEYVGIDVTVTSMGSAEFLSQYRAGQLDLFLLGWGADHLHPDNFLSPHFCDPSNLGFGPQDAALCDLLDSALSEPDYADQLALYRSASTRVMETLPAFPLVHDTPLLAARRGVTGLVPSPMGFEWFGPVFVASDWTYLPAVRR